LRPFNQYGPCQHLEKVVPRFITSAILGEPLTVHGAGGMRRDWMFVQDTCRYIESAVKAPLEKVRGEVFNLGTGSSPSVLDVAEMTLDFCGRPRSLVSHIGDRLGQVERHCACTVKSDRVLGAFNRRPIDVGLKQTIEWYRENETWWREIEWMKKVRVLTTSGCEEDH
jgi:dTDP-glucose 4,6-dehydratase